MCHCGSVCCSIKVTASKNKDNNIEIGRKNRRKMGGFITTKETQLSYSGCLSGNERKGQICYFPIKSGKRTSEMK